MYKKYIPERGGNLIVILFSLYLLSICLCQSNDEDGKKLLSNGGFDFDLIGVETNAKKFRELVTTTTESVNVKVVKGSQSLRNEAKRKIKLSSSSWENETFLTDSVPEEPMILLDSDSGDDLSLPSSARTTGSETENLLVSISSCCKLKPPSHSHPVNENLNSVDSENIKNVVEIDTRRCTDINKNVNLTTSYKVYLDALRKNKNVITTENIWTVPGDLMITNYTTDFILQETPLFCTKEIIHANISYNVSTPGRNFLLPNGYLKIGKESYAPDEYCIDGFTPENVEVKVCQPDCGNTRACIPKCCSLDKVYSMGASSPGDRTNRGCRNPIWGQGHEKRKHTFFNPPLYHDFHHKLTPLEMSQQPKPHFYDWHPTNFKRNCFQNKTAAFPNSLDVANMLSTTFNVDIHSMNFKIRKDGAVLYINSISRKCAVEKEPERAMCFDGVQDFGDGRDFANSEGEMVIFLCNYWNAETLKGHSNELIYGILMVAVSVFPLLTCIVYLLLWKKQTVHGWTIAATTGSLFFMYVFQGSAFITASLYGRAKLGSWSCIFIGIIGHFFLLATFSWLTVMCGDLWWTFRMLTPTNRRSKGITRYIKYSLFGWGFPAAFVLTGVILDITLKSKDCTIHTLPMYGEQSCWITPSSQGLYAYYPIAVLLSLNIFFFAVTCYKLCRYRKNTKFATKKETDHWKGLTRFTKLFLVMGVSWQFEVLAWSIDGLNMQWYWVCFDIINIMRAIGIFVVYVCKQDILLMLEDSHPGLKKVFRRFKRRRSNDTWEQTASTSPGTLMMSSRETRTL